MVSLVPRFATAHPPSRPAFTLVEVLIALVVLGLATVAVTQAVTAGQMQTHDTLHRTRAVALAEAMLEEVLSKSYGDPDGSGDIGPDAGENERADYDDIDDYHDFSEVPGNVTDRAGNAYPQAYQHFSRSVSVSEQTVSISPFGSVDGLMVQVTISDQTGASWSLSRFIPEATAGNDGRNNGGGQEQEKDGEDEDEDEDEEDEDEEEEDGDDDEEEEEEDDDHRGRGRGRGRPW